MSEEDLKAVLAKYQQKSFELYNSNIVLETQVEQLNASVTKLKADVEKLKKAKKEIKVDENYS